MEINKLTFSSTDKSKKVLEKYAKPWDEIKYHIKTVNGGKSAEQITLNMKNIK